MKVLISIAIIIVFSLPSCGNGDAEDHALTYARKLGPGYSSLGCVAEDSDNDGYVSCTIRHPDGDRSGIQCATGIGSCNSGCKEDRVH
jgi:hypothetical protein